MTGQSTNRIVATIQLLIDEQQKAAIVYFGGGKVALTAIHGLQDDVLTGTREGGGLFAIRMDAIIAVEEGTAVPILQL